MRNTSLATLAAALVIGSSGTVYAQGSNQGQGYGTQQFGQGGPSYGAGQQYGQGQSGWGSQQYGQSSGAQQQFGQSSSSSRFQERAALRRQLRQVGFQNIRILNAAYLIQASTPDGRTVLMVVDPPAQMTSQISGGPMMGQQNQRFGGQMGQMGQMGQQNQRYGMGYSQGMQGMSGSGDQQSTAQSQMGSGQSGTGATGSVSQGTNMSENQVRSMLQQRGLSNIQNLEREGNTFTASADWQGEQVDVSVNAATGEITQPSDL